MRKTLVVLVSVGLAAGLLAAPGHAGGKKKKVEDSFTVTAPAPLPNISSYTGTEKPSCTAGEEDVHKVTTPLHVPGKGKLTVDLSGFQGDWDLYVFDAQERVIGTSASEQIPGGAPPEESISLAFKKMGDISMVACNWAGSPEAEFHYKLIYKAAKGHHH